MGIQGCFFDIKRYAIHDGPGIRISVFSKVVLFHAGGATIRKVRILCRR